MIRAESGAWGATPTRGPEPGAMSSPCKVAPQSASATRKRQAHSGRHHLRSRGIVNNLTRLARPGASATASRSGARRGPSRGPGLPRGVTIEPWDAGAGGTANERTAHRALQSLGSWMARQLPEGVAPPGHHGRPDHGGSGHPQAMALRDPLPACPSRWASTPPSYRWWSTRCWARRGPSASSTTTTIGILTGRSSPPSYRAATRPSCWPPPRPSRPRGPDAPDRRRTALRGHRPASSRSPC